MRPRRHGRHGPLAKGAEWYYSAKIASGDTRATIYTLARRYRAQRHAEKPMAKGDDRRTIKRWIKGAKDALERAPRIVPGDWAYIHFADWFGRFCVAHQREAGRAIRLVR